MLDNEVKRDIKQKALKYADSYIGDSKHPTLRKYINYMSKREDGIMGAITVSLAVIYIQVKTGAISRNEGAAQQNAVLGVLETENL